MKRGRLTASSYEVPPKVPRPWRGDLCGKPLGGSGLVPSFYGHLAGKRPPPFRQPAESVAKHPEEGFSELLARPPIRWDLEIGVSRNAEHSGRSWLVAARIPQPACCHPMVVGLSMRRNRVMHRLP
jgi:hypothetical protein